MPNPNVKRLTHGQLVALRIEWRRLKADDDPRADGSLGRIYEDSHDGRISWAEDHLGITGLQAWDYLDIKEAAYLLDILWSKRSKLMGYLHALLLAKGIQSPESWFASIQDRERLGCNRNVWKFQGRSLAQCNRRQLHALCEQLSPRQAPHSGVRAPASKAAAEPSLFPEMLPRTFHQRGNH